MSELDNIEPASVKIMKTMECKYCKNQIKTRALKCEKCGEWLNMTRFIHGSSVTLSLLVALFSIISLTYESAYDFYIENMREKVVDLEISILNSGTQDLNIIVMNKGSADALLERIRMNVERTYQNELGVLKNLYTKDYSYKPVGYKDNPLLSIVPAGEYRVLKLSGATDKHPNRRGRRIYKDEKMIIKIVPDIININTMKKASVTRKVHVGAGTESSQLGYLRATLNPDHMDQNHSYGETITTLKCDILYKDGINHLCKRFSRM